MHFKSRVPIIQYSSSGKTSSEFEDYLIQIVIPIFHDSTIPVVAERSSYAFSIPSNPTDGLF